jgi:hypothetical protein
MQPACVQGRTSPRAALPGSLPAIGLLVPAAVALLTSLLPFGPVRGYLDSFARTGAAHEYTPALHAGITAKLRLAGAGLFIAGLLTWRLRARLARLLGGLLSRVRAELREVRCALRAARPDPRHAAALLAVVALAAALRLAFLSQPMRYDEAFTYAEYASRPLHVVVSKYDYPNNHVFHSLCVHAACALLGDSPWAIRLPAFLAGVLVVPACYAAARALYGRPAALLSACLAAGSSVLIEYSTNARGYALITLLFLLLIRLGCVVLRRPTVLGWGLLSALAALGFWTVPVMLFPYGALVLWLAAASFAGPRTRATYGRSFPRWLIGSGVLTVLLTALLYAPVLLVSGLKALTANQFVAPLDGARWRERVVDSLLATAGQWHRDVPAVLAVALAAGFLVAVFSPARAGARPASRPAGGGAPAGGGRRRLVPAGGGRAARPALRAGLAVRAAPVPDHGLGGPGSAPGTLAGPAPAPVAGPGGRGSRRRPARRPDAGVAHGGALDGNRHLAGCGRRGPLRERPPRLPGRPPGLVPLGRAPGLLPPPRGRARLPPGVEPRLAEGRRALGRRAPAGRR